MLTFWLFAGVVGSPPLGRSSSESLRRPCDRHCNERFCREKGCLGPRVVGNRTRLGGNLDTVSPARNHASKRERAPVATLPVGSHARMPSNARTRVVSIREKP